MNRKVDLKDRRTEQQKHQDIEAQQATKGCGDSNHNFQLVGTQGYYKSENGSFTKDTVYNMVFCTKCAETKEIVICRR